MKTKILVAALAVLVIPSASAVSQNDFTVSPQDFQVNISQSGANATQDITVDYTGHDEARVELSTNITPTNTSNAEGINASFEDSTFDIGFREEKTQTLLIETHPALKPDTFNIEVLLRVNSLDEDGDGSYDPESYSRNVSQDIGLDEDTISDEDKLNRTDNETDTGNQTGTGNESTTGGQNVTDPDDIDEPGEASTTDTWYDEPLGDDAPNYLAILFVLLLGGFLVWNYQEELSAKLESLQTDGEKKARDDLPNPDAG
jgi:hypothetical protein